MSLLQKLNIVLTRQRHLILPVIEICGVPFILYKPNKIKSIKKKPTRILKIIKKPFYEYYDHLSVVKAA